MNRLFLTLGILLLMALTTALIAPRFIDWSTYTAVIEEQASRLLGREVHVSGAVDLRFLPMPRLTFSDVEIASRQDGSVPEIGVERMEALMSLAPFLRGEAEIVELRLERPVVRLSALSDRRPDSSDDRFDPGSVQIDEAVIVDGRIERLTSTGDVQVLVDELNATMSAQSLLGPWRVDPATAIINGERATLRINSGRYGGDRRMRLRVSVLPVSRPMEIVLDGHLDWSGEQAARFEGQGLARSLDELIETAETPPLSWRVEGAIDAGLGGLNSEDFEIALGQAGDQAFLLNGRAEVNLGNRPRFSAEVSSRQVDLDRMLGGGAAAPVSLEAGWQAAGALVRWIDQTPIPGGMAFDIPAIVVGGSVIRDIAFEATYRPGLPIGLSNLQAVVPGETSLGFTGTVAAVGAVDGQDLALEGRMVLESAAPDLFVRWSTGRQDEGGTFSQLTSARLSGRLIADPDEVSLSGLQGAIDGAGLTGSLVYLPVGEAGSSLDINLNAGRFDFGLLAGLGRWLTGDDSAAAPSLVDRLNASLSIDELVAGAENLGEVSVEVAATPDQLVLEDVSVGDAAGARIRASGVLERGAMPPIGSLAIDADMERIGGLVRLVRDVTGDHPLLLDLARNANLYEPGSLVVGDVVDAESGLDVDIDGTGSGTEVSLAGLMPPSEEAAPLPQGLGGFFDRPAELRFSAQSNDAFALIGQLGIPALPIDLGGEGSFVASLNSNGSEAPDVRVAFDGLQTSLRLNGKLNGSVAEGVTGMTGTGSLFADDVAQLGLMAGMALPGLFDPISASAQFDVAYDLGGETLQLDGLAGTFADVPVAGSASVRHDPLGFHADIDLEADRIDMRSVLAGFVGPSAFDQGFSASWPEGPLAFNPLPAMIDLRLRAPQMELWDDVVARQTEMVLIGRDAQVTVDQLTGQLYGGDLDARLSLRDADRGALATGRLALTDFDADRLAWERQGRPIVGGEASLSVSFETSGGSIASLMSGLTGEGTIGLDGVAVSGLGLEGFSRILQASDAGLLREEDDLRQAFSDALGAGTMLIDSAQTPVTLIGGVLQASNLYISSAMTALRGGLSVDLSTGDLDADFSYAATDGPGDVEAMPNVGLSFAGPIASPDRDLDVSQVASFLNVRRLEQEIRRVEALNAEILERERLLRIMAAVDLDQTRLQAEEAARLEQERLDQERRAAEEAERAARDAAEAEERRLAEEAAREAEAQAAQEAAEQAAREAAEAEAARQAEEQAALEAAEEEARLAAEEAARQAEEQAAREAARLAEEQREQALREALLERERQQQVLDLSLPSLGEPIFVEPNPLVLGEEPPRATGAPLDLSPN